MTEEEKAIVKRMATAIGPVYYSSPPTAEQCLRAYKEALAIAVENGDVKDTRKLLSQLA